MFSTGDTTNTLIARSNNNGAATNFTIPGTWLGSPHRFRIDWGASTIVYSIDGTVVSTHSVAIVDTMRPVASDFTVGGPAVAIDWVRMTPYTSAGTFDSRIFDAGGAADWSSLSWTASSPAGTSIAVSYRRGNTSSPDGTWTSFQSIASSGDALSGTSRYIQYRASLATTNTSNTPSLNSVTIGYVLSSDTTAPSVTINQASSQVDPTDTSPIHFDVVFSEPVADFATGDVTLAGTAGATTAVVSGSGTTYDVAVSGMTSDGTVIASLLAGVAHDAATNASAASTSTDNTVTYDNNDAPTAVDDTFTATEDTDLVRPASGIGSPAFNDTDPDGDTLTVTVVGSATGGTVALAAGSITFSPTANLCGPGAGSFGYTVSDGTLSDTGLVTVDISCVNDAPVAASQAVTPTRTRPRRSPSGASDADGDSLTYAIGTGPAHGSLSGTAPALTYTPAPNYHGPDSFTFTASDGPATSNVATVSITVTSVNDTPTLTNPGQPEQRRGQQPEPPDRGRRRRWRHPDLRRLRPAHGPLDQPATGLISGSLDFASAGSYPVTVTVTDGIIASPVEASFTWTVGGTNRAPVAASQTVTTGEDTATPIALRRQ